jgi:predicted dehydrogenase
MDPMMMWGSTRQEVGEADKTRWRSLQPGQQPADIRAYLDCIDTGQRPQITAEDAERHIEVIAAAYESAKSGKPVKIGA